VIALVLAAVLHLGGDLEPALPSPGPGQASAWVGVLLDDATDGGVRILSVVPGGPADRGGIQAGDLVLRLNGDGVLDQPAFSRILSVMAPGQPLAVELMRGGALRTVAFPVGDRRASPLLRRQMGIDLAGVELKKIPAELRRHYGAPPEAGALVVDVHPHGAAARAGVAVGDVVVRAGPHPVVEELELRRALAQAGAGPLPLHVLRRGEALTLTLAPLGPLYAGPGGDQARVRELETTIEALRARVAALEAEIARLTARPDSR
jgi:S1-C subfamily serine protease